MDQLLQGVKFTVCRLDDILISGGSPNYLQILEDVFERLQDHGIRLNPAKCIFPQPGLEFLEH